MGDDLELTQVFTFGENLIGYMVNTGLSYEGQQAVSMLQSAFDKQFPGLLWPAPAESLHITLFDWLAPLIDYGRDKDELFDEIEDSYKAALASTVEGISSILVHFSEIIVSPGAIIIKGHDNGQYQQIRKNFVDKVELLPNTKLPPTIIHSSIARYRAEIPVKEVQQFAKSITVDLAHVTNEFRLIRETKTPMLEFKVLEILAL